MTSPQFSELHRAASAGAAEAQYQLALCYFNGARGAPSDRDAGVEWCRRAANQGHEQARFLLDSLTSKRDPLLVKKSRERVRKQPARAEAAPALQPITFAPKLYTLNGCGAKLYGRADYDDDTETFLATYYAVILFFPIFPIARYRVSRDDNYYTFYGKAPFRMIEKLHLLLFAGWLLWFIYASRH